MYSLGDFLHTTKGILTVQCVIKFVDNASPRYDKLGGKTLFWCQDEQFQDVFYWDNDLAKILIKDESGPEDNY